VAGATQWFSGDSSLTGRQQYDKGPLTDGTPGVLDFQDSATVTTALAGYYFQKTVGNLTSGANPATTALRVTDCAIGCASTMLARRSLDQDQRPA